MTDTAHWHALLDRLDRLARVAERWAAQPEAGLPLTSGRAFLWEGPAGFRPVRRLAAVEPGVLAGIDLQKEAFYANVRRFAGARPAHDVLLWGERGTGKSSLVRSLPLGVRDPSLSLLEIPEHRIPDLPHVLDTLDADSRRWILYLDDLSFVSPGDRYRELKVLLEGGLEARPENTLVVATSNRRHLVPEAFPEEDEIHPEEAVAETVSLADRFGLSLGFYAFDEATYLEAVARHLDALGVAPPAGWRDEAVRWAMARGIRSGRTALQAAREIGGRATPATLAALR